MKMMAFFYGAQSVHYVTYSETIKLTLIFHHFAVVWKGHAYLFIPLHHLIQFLYIHSEQTAPHIFLILIYTKFIYVEPLSIK